MSNPGTGPVYQLGQDFRLQPQRRLLQRSGEPVALPSRAFDVLVILVEERHRPVTKDELSERVWGGVSVTQNNLNQSITALRKVFGDSRQASNFIATVPNVGYQFVAPVSLAIVQPEAPAPPPAPSVAASRRWPVPAAAALIAILLLGAAAWRWQAARPIPIAIATFVNLQQDDQYDWLSPSLARMAASALGPGIEPRPQPEDALNPTLPHQAWSARELADLAKKLRATYLLVGSFTIPTPNTIRIRIALSRGAAGEVAAQEATGPLNDFTAIATGLVHQLRQALPPAAPVADRSMLDFAAGVSQLRNGDLPGAAATLRQALAANPRQPLILSALGAVLLDLGHSSEATLLLEKAFELKDALPNDQKTLVEARYHAAIGEWEPAVEGLRAHWIRNPDRLDAGLELAYAQFRSRNAKAAQETVETCARLIEGAAGDPRLLLLRARILGGSGEMDNARRTAAAAAEAALKKEMPYFRARARLFEAGASQNLGLYPAAQQLREEAKALCAKLDDRVCLSSAWRVEGNLALSTEAKKAAKCYWNSLRLARASGNSGERINVLNGLGTAMLQDGKFQQAEAVYRDLLKSDLQRLGFTAPYGMLAEALLGQRRFQEAEQAALEAIRLSKAAEDPEGTAKAYLHLALARHGQGQVAGVVALFDKALGLFEQVRNPDFTKEALIHYARFLVAQWQLERAEEVLQRAASQSPELHKAILSTAMAELQQAQAQAQRTRGAGASVQPLPQGRTPRGPA